MLRRLLAVVLLSLLAVQGCSRSEGRSTNRVQSVTEELPIEFTIEMRGDRDITVRKQVVQARFIVITTDDEELRPQTIFGVEPLDPIRVNGVGVKPGVGVNPFEGDGRYSIVAGSPFAAPEPGKAPAEDEPRSSISVEWWPPQGEPEQFVRRDKSCSVVVKDDGTKGTLDCPRVTGEAKDVFFSLKMTWDVVGEVPKPRPPGQDEPMPDPQQQQQQQPPTSQPQQP